MARPLRVLLLWPGTTGAAAGNFGVPQLVTMATYVAHHTGARVDVVDLVTERALGTVSLERVFRGEDGRGYDLVGFSVYASYDYLKCVALAEVARAVLPSALLVAGGYHASARPTELVHDGSVFDVCVVGEGERPLRALVERLEGGERPRSEVLGPDPIEDLEELPPTDWSRLERYRAVARTTASQAQVYLSRGCPFDCAFCMERAKREVSWRAYSVERALDELRRLHAFLGLEAWTVYLADALFGMKTSWRRSFLEALAREAIPARKWWLLIRVDLVDDEDLRLFARANCGLGFGLESGDPAMLSRIRKAGRLDTYLDRMAQVARTARALNLPWGANVIVGHPGETEASLRRSAAYLRGLFLDPQGTTGFLSVDPYRYYPGSPIDQERGAWERDTGAVFHRPSWWHDGDQEFLSEWVDPSRELTYRRREALQAELLGPVLTELPRHYRYQGAERGYFIGAITEQLDNLRPRARLHFAERYYAWQRYLRRRAEPERDGDLALREVCRAVRAEAVELAARRSGVGPEAWRGEPWRPLREALEEVPRERFVPLDAVLASTRDEPVAVDATGQSTVSALHAYLRAYALLGVRAGDRVLDLGCGTGYGLALLSRLVGPGGSVHGVEVDPALAALAARNTAGCGNVTVSAGDATDPAAWGVARPTRVVAGFALEALPPSWAGHLGDPAVVVCPLETPDGQRLVRARFARGSYHIEWLDAVRYVGTRHAVTEAAETEETAQPSVATPRRLPVVGRP
ncbi:MAG: radical SAM protein [Deltaproteobacteria bacterium]|nr:radical SAM protein [Deltaproteobacteria bacterium]